MLYCRNCKTEMSVLTIADSPRHNYAFNVQQCDSCDTIVKHDLWKNAGFLWVMTDGTIIHEKEEKKK